MKLEDIFNAMDHINKRVISCNAIIEINDITLNSKEAGKHFAFTAIKGFKTDGHKFITDAYENGCRNFIISDPALVDEAIIKSSTIISVDDTRLALALISNILYEKPFDRLKMIGITGTKGKTTVSTLLHRFLSEKFKTSKFSTVSNTVCGKTTDSERTTMEASCLQKRLKLSADYGETHSVVEVSSHAVTLKRVEGIEWDAGIFTSFSRDHLDLYGTIEKYFDAKLDFFKALNKSKKKNRLAVINIDDPKGNEVVDTIGRSVKVIKVGLGQNADFIIAKNNNHGNNGLEFSVAYIGRRYDIRTKMRGEFNITNISLAFVTAMESGVDPGTMIKILEDFSGVEGRFEIVINNPFTVIIDYAHTPDSLEKILHEARAITNDKLTCVFGCTGDRDKDKRSIMGSIAALNADFTVITDDDTYTEDPAIIAAAVEQGFKDEGKKKGEDYEIIHDRYSAVKEAMHRSSPGNVVLIAGMGHEKHQIIGSVAVPYNDKESVLKIAEEMSIITRDGNK